MSERTGGPDWDITSTRQPAREAAFDTSEGTWMSVTVSPDGETIVFDLLGDLYAVPARGGSARPLRPGPAMDRMPVFSPTGSRILYLSDASGEDEAWSCALDGSDARRHTEQDGGILTEPIWGPDGSCVIAPRVFREHRKLFSSQIRLYEPGSTGHGGRLLVDVPDSGRDVLEPALSPDGAWLYYTERLTSQRLYIDTLHANFAIRRRRLSDGHTETVVGGFGGAFRPSVSPDGRRLAFLRRVKAKTVLFTLDLETGRQRPVFDGLDRDNSAVWELQGNYYPRFSWFPNARHVAIWAGGGILRVDTETGAHEAIPFRAEVRKTVAEPVRPRHDLAPERVRARAIRHLAVAPGGRDLAFTALGRVWHTSLGAAAGSAPDAAADSASYAAAGFASDAALDAASGVRPVPVGDHSRHGADPVFSADGARLAYVEWDDEAGSALRIVRDGGEPVTVVTSGGVIRQPAFSPDGSLLAYLILPHDPHIGGSRSRPGLYVAPAGGDARRRPGPGPGVLDGPRYLGPGADAPCFSPDGTRVYASATDDSGEEPAEELFSVDLSGGDRRVHARAADVDTYELRLSPDHRWLAFRHGDDQYVLPYRETGHPLAVGAFATDVPCRRLTEHGGYALAWASDGAAVHWAVGPEVYGARAGTWETTSETVELTVPYDVPPGCVALTGARVITMAGDAAGDAGAVYERATVVVRGHRIEAVGPDVVPPEDAEVIDCAGMTIMPGLIDGHGHIDGAAGEGVTPRKQANRYAALAFGVTTNFDPFCSELPNFESAETTMAGLTVGPRWIGTGSAIHGRPHNFFHLYSPISCYADASGVVGRKKELGALAVKSYKWPGRAHRQMLVEAAREHGVNIVVEGETHFYNNISMILDGHTNLEHNLPVATCYDDVIRLMAAAGVSNTPTLMVAFGELFGENYMYQRTEIWKDPRVRTFVQACLSGYSPLGTPYGAPPHARAMTTIQVSDELYDVGVLAVSRTVRRMDEAGVRINAGSHGQVPGAAMHWELALLAAGGMEPHRVLRTATVNMAESLGVGDQLGALEPGMLADLIVLRENPLDDVRNTETVAMTMVNGRLYDAETLDEIAPDKRPRTHFYWELSEVDGIDWNEAWGGPSCH